jgi:uncharacterized protein YfaS (alpha-2-macroglobulin family)
VEASGVTEDDGEARLEFKLTNPLQANMVELEVSAEANGFSQKTKEDVWLLYPNQILVSTDKSLYQPGQLLHMRILGFDHKLKAIGNADGTLKIRDPENTIIFRSAIKTSRFGVASVDWPIPENARLGQYWIEVWLGEESPYNARGSEVFRSRKRHCDDVLPDRVIFYLWPPAGGVKFDFKFRARYGIKAKSAPSVLYDYYNPEARAVVAPVQFVVR